MKKLTLSSIAALCVFAVAPTAHASGPSARLIELAEAEQRAALVKCTYKAGLREPTELKVTYLVSTWGGPSTLRVLPGRGIDKQTSAQLNECLYQKTGHGSQSFTTPEDVATRAKKRKCVSIMVNGNGYCFNRP